jgi:PQQ-like domain
MKNIARKTPGKGNSKVAAKKSEKVYGQASSKAPAVPMQPLPKPGMPTVLLPVESGMKSVTVGDVIAGAHVDVYVNGEWRGSAIATEATVEVGILSGPLHEGDRVTARQIVSDIIKGPSKPVTTVSSVGFYYLTQHFDVARTGWNPYETKLTAANVGNLKWKFAQDLDGRSYTQPLYAHHVNVHGVAHNVVFVATEKDWVYAFDADTKQPPLWHRQLVPAGEQFLEYTDIPGCYNLTFIGITSTPVIDMATNTMWVVAKTKAMGETLQGSPRTIFYYRLYALDIATGADRVPPVEIAGKVPGTAQPNDGQSPPHVVFDAHWHLNRAALLLLNGVVYVSFCSHCDQHKGSYQGWVFAYNAATLTFRKAFSSCPDTPVNSQDEAGGIWQGGMGLAADSAGSIYFTTGNGDLTAPKGRNYGDTVIKLSPALTVTDFFTPSNQLELSGGDHDLGSGGVLILPDPVMLVLPDTRTRRKPAALVTAGKDGNILLIDRMRMGGYTPPDPLKKAHDKLLQYPPLQMKPGALPKEETGVWGGPAYFRSSQQQQFVYYCGSGGHLKAYLFSGDSLALSMFGSKPNQSPHPFYYEDPIDPNTNQPNPVNPIGEGGVTPNVSSDNQISGTGVVWAITRTNPLQLLAFDALDLTHILLGFPVDPEAPSKGHIGLVCGPWKGGGIPMIEPTTIQGKVYVASDGELNIFGL